MRDQMVRRADRCIDHQVHWYPPQSVHLCQWSLMCRRSEVFLSNNLTSQAKQLQLQSIVIPFVVDVYPPSQSSQRNFNITEL